MELNKIHNVDVLTGLKQLPDNVIDCVVTSPPYWGLRDYGEEAITIWGGDTNCEHEWGNSTTRNSNLQAGNPEFKKTWREQVSSDAVLVGCFCTKCGAWRGQLGHEPTPELYVEHLVEIFREVRRVLKPEGTLWLNLGDSYVRTKTCGRNDVARMYGRNSQQLSKHIALNVYTGLKPKNLIGIPWMVAFALRNDGWWLRQDIVWCLSGETYVYVRSQNGDMPMMVKDLARLQLDTIKLWNGHKWTHIKGMWLSKRTGDEIEIELRSGERISCTPEHLWPTKDGFKKANELKIGDILLSCQLPEPEKPSTHEYVPDEIGWFIGLYLANGLRDSNGRIQIASHTQEVPKRLERLNNIIAKYNGTYQVYYEDGNTATIDISSKMLNAIIDTYINGNTAKDKCLTTACWQRSNQFLQNLLQGYLEGDGHWDDKNKRWRICFARNYNFERDLRTLCARLGYVLTLKLGEVSCDGKRYKVFRGEIRLEQNKHWNHKDTNKIIAIRKSLARQFWDIEVEDEPHVFALASGILTHNSKPNAMPESVKDRCTRAHEYIFHLSKSHKYYYDYEAVLEEATGYDGRKNTVMKGSNKYKDGAFLANEKTQSFHVKGHGRWQFKDGIPLRNRRSVWVIPTRPFKGAHFATFPIDLVEIPIKAGCPEGGVVLDPFMGSGTVAVAAKRLNRNFIGFEINPYYCEMAVQRISAEQ